ncbi:hypothetical protein CROQUDRAFT_658510 [Cronartium quercuum f. sp. fusiforme G11]|uniref:Uncharacterized protein n=1 Tax=Cronartium quercuum f. sp. fusiforme G11 TaxID=708437 RepID=A0A9P6NHB1_9BASI|nr:hypothetical protein CROQUDRAFT_658510 [Cronartium quercuum f. sp. fusiforme G11]
MSRPASVRTEESATASDGFDLNNSRSMGNDDCLSIDSFPHPLGEMATSTSCTYSRTNLSCMSDSCEEFASRDSDCSAARCGHDSQVNFGGLTLNAQRTASSTGITARTIPLEERRARAKALACSDEKSNIIPLLVNSPAGSSPFRTVSLISNQSLPQMVQSTALVDDSKLDQINLRQTTDDRYQQQRHPQNSQSSNDSYALISITNHDSGRDGSQSITNTFKRALSKNLVGRSSNNALKNFHGKTNRLKGASNLLSSSACQNHMAMEIVKTVSVIVESSVASSNSTSSSAVTKENVGEFEQDVCNI